MGVGGYLLRFFTVLFLVFLVVGNLTAPTELTSDDVHVDGVMGAFYKVGKFFVVPFENLKYRLGGGDNAGEFEFDDSNLEPVQTVQSGVPPGYVEKYFKFQGEKYKFYKPLNPKKSQVREEFEFSKGYDGMLGWKDFTAGDLVEDLYSEPVNEVFKLSLDALYEKYDKEDKKIFIKYLKIQGECPNGWCERVNPVSVYAPLFPIVSVAQPTPEVLRHALVDNAEYFMEIGWDTDPALPSKVIKAEASVDCDGIVLYDYAFLYRLNKLMGVKAEYYKVGFHGYLPNGEMNPVGHAELFVYYPETGKWEVYSTMAVTEYFYKYTSRDIDLEAYREYSYTRQIVARYIEKGYPVSLTLSVIVVKDNGKIKPPELYVPVGKLQFNSFEEALYWYLYSNIIHNHASLYTFITGRSGGSTPEENLKKFENYRVMIFLQKLPTPEDPKVYKVMNWYGKEATLNRLKKDLVKKGQYREIKFVINKGEPPEFLKKPKPWLNEDNAPPWSKEDIIRYKKYKEKAKNEDSGESIIDLLIKGFKNLFKGTRLGG
ncbi:hypothetical protein E3E38_04225 [Thermococcus sp. 18S1]|uniref:hypothetical protein n=1 Tax=Thermococcus sp. 18S1 TaxID=1638210 RepID=UPI00143BA8C0|nr:hypothetical protein [Thermococcus sp. 18S1]NJE30259.1 hypothetical protein [Thermococcus sp. 18S1]